MKQIRIMLKVSVKDRNGRVIATRRKRAGYLFQFGAIARQVFVYALGGGTTGCKDITGAGKFLETLVTIANQVFVCVGTSTTAVTVQDYKLGAEIGTVVASVGGLTDTGSDCRFAISGTYTWAAGGTINEVGVRGIADATVGTPQFQWLRDVIVPVVVPAGGTITVVYTLIFPK